MGLSLKHHRIKVYDDRNFASDKYFEKDKVFLNDS